MQSARVVLFCVLLIASALDVRPSKAAAGKTIIRQRVCWSPNCKMRAVIIYYEPRLYGTGESRLDIWDGRNRLLASRDYACGGTQGYQVQKAAWTADSQYLVFSMASAGGHSPWHSPTNFYEVRSSTFYAADALVKGDAVTSADFNLSPPALLGVVGRDDRKMTLNLRGLSVAERKRARIEEQRLWLHLQSGK